MVYQMRVSFLTKKSTLKEFREMCQKMEATVSARLRWLIREDIRQYNLPKEKEGGEK